MRTTCAKCGKPLDGKNRSWCKACFSAWKRADWSANVEARRAYLREWQQANPEKMAKYMRKWKLKNVYGLSQERYEAMREEQGNLCLVCSVVMTDDKSASGVTVDHDHDDGDVRGLLCSNCNRGIGYFGDDPDRLVAAAAYLLRHSMKRQEKG